MTEKDLCENKYVLKIIEDLKKSGIRLADDLAEQADHIKWFIKSFDERYNNILQDKKQAVINIDEFLPNVWEKDNEDLFKFIEYSIKHPVVFNPKEAKYYHELYSNPIPYSLIVRFLFDFCFLKYAPNKSYEHGFLYMGWPAKELKKQFLRLSMQYKKALGIEE